MGHDISSFNKKTVKEISYLRFSASSVVGQYLFYESLNAQCFNGGCSGNGEEKEYTVDEIKTAKAKLNYILGEDTICDEIGAYSLDERHDFFKSVMGGLGVNSDEAFSEKNKEEVEFYGKEINEFFDKIIESGETTVMIIFG
jgi:hypothetical protein